MKKLDPRELRRKVEDIESDDSYSKANSVVASNSEKQDQASEFENLRDFLKKSLKHKKVLFLSFALLYSLSIYFYFIHGVWFEKKTTISINNSSNNSFFKFLDQSFSENNNSKDDAESYAGKALTNLDSDSFINFCFEKALEKPEVSEVFGLKFKEKKLEPNEAKKNIKRFFNTKMIIAPFEKSLRNTRSAKGGFQITVTDYDLGFVDSSPKIISGIIKDYLAGLDASDSESAAQLLKNKISEVQKKITESKEKKFKIYQMIPLVDKSSVYALQSQLQATKITISGNKALEEQFQESLENIENKISTIGDVGSVESDPTALSLELTSLSKQKAQLQSQGLEKESFLYKNIAASLSKTLKELEESQKSLAVNQKKDESLFFQAKVADLNKYLDEINVFIADKLEKKSLASDLENSLSINFPENPNQKATSVPQAPALSKESVDGLLSQLESLKKVIEGNNFFESKLNQKIAGTEKRLSALRPNPLEQKDVSGFIQDISNMAYLKNQLKLQGVDEDSVIAKRITENIKKATKELQEKKNISLKDLKIGDMYTPTFDEASVYSQKVTLEKLKGENNFYQAKIVELNKAIDELGFLLNDKAEKETQISELELVIKKDQLTVDSLNNSLLKMDLSDIKATKKLSFYFHPTEEKTALPLNMFLLMSLGLSFFLALSLSYFREVQSPTLKTIESFEDLGLEVLGGLPSTKNNLLQEGSVLDGLTNASYLRMGISIENTMSSSDGKIILLTSSDTSLKSATIALNLGAFFGNTGKKILILETDLVNNSVAKVTGAPLNGGVSELYLHKEKINFYPFRVSEGLDVLTGDPLLVPPVYRLVSNNFKTFLEQLGLQYDYVFLHVRPCLDSPEASDLSRYADMGIVCCDTETINKQILDKLDKEMNAFLSKNTCLILENPKDLDLHVEVKPEIQKVAA